MSTKYSSLEDNGSKDLTSQPCFLVSVVLNLCLLIAVIILAVILVSPSTAPSSSVINQNRQNRQLLGHRGSPFYAPEHTLASYSIAFRQGVDYIEPDLVFTKDGQLISLHDLGLNSTTNVWDFPEFRDRVRTIDLGDTPKPQNHTDVFCFDLTLEEIKKLRIKQRVSSRDPNFDGLFQIPTLVEILTNLKSWNTQFGANVGVYPECKHPNYLEKVAGFNFTEKLLPILRDFGYTDSNSNIYIQSFDPNFLIDLHKRTSIKLVQLVDSPSNIVESDRSEYGVMLTPTGLKKVAQYASVVSPWKAYFFPWINSTGGFPFYQDALRGPELIKEAHKNNLSVSTWTVRHKIEDGFKLERFQGDQRREILYLMEQGVDSFFVEDMSAALEARLMFEYNIKI